MGRPKKYDPDEVLDKAMTLFHRKGFHSTSTPEIVEQVGINKFSLYAEFGSNKKLFDRALIRYYEVNFQNNFGFLEATTAGIDEIKLCFEAFLGDNDDNPGCMLCNTSIEFSNQDAASNLVLEHYFKRIPAAVKNSLDNAAAEGCLIKGLDTANTAHLLNSIILGLLVQLRAKASASQLRQSCESALTYVESICS